MGDRNFYIDLYSDETMPCAPTLEAWAHWLSKPDESWPHPIPADGETFAVSTIDILAEIKATKTADGWVFDREPPPNATGFVCRAGLAGWDAETWSDTPRGHLDECDGYYAVGDVEELVCTISGPSMTVRFDASGPSLIPVEAQ